jgi:hypothetical protein
MDYAQKPSNPLYRVLHTIVRALYDIRVFYQSFITMKYLALLFLFSNLLLKHSLINVLCKNGVAFSTHTYCRLVLIPMNSELETMWKEEDVA